MKIRDFIAKMRATIVNLNQILQGLHQSVKYVLEQQKIVRIIFLKKKKCFIKLFKIDIMIKLSI